MHTFKKVIIAAVIATSAGCSTFTGGTSGSGFDLNSILKGLSDKFTNSISCSTDGKKAFFNSMYWLFGITSTVNQGDATSICSPNLPSPSAQVTK